MGMQQMLEGVAWAVDPDHFAGGIGLFAQQIADSFRIHVFTGGKEDGAVERVKVTVGVGTGLDQQIGGIKVSESRRLGERLVEPQRIFFGQQAADGFEISGGGGEKQRGIGISHGYIRIAIVSGYANSEGMQASDGPWERLRRRMERLGLREEDLTEAFVLGSGSGGQKVNKTAQAVQVVHAPSGIVVKCSSGRSQHLNRLGARERLCEVVEEERARQKLERDAERAKRRFQRRKPSARQKAKRVEGKRIRGETKKLRKRPSRGEE